MSRSLSVIWAIVISILVFVTLTALGQDSSAPAQGASATQEAAAGGGTQALQKPRRIQWQP